MPNQRTIAIGLSFYRSERTYGKFERRIVLPEGVNSDDMSCTFNNGILEIRMKEIQDKTGDKPEKVA